MSLTPGPNSLLALTHGALYGRRKSLFTVAGGAIGFAIIIALSLFGIGALLQASTTLFMALKIIGGGYLIWLGIQLWRAPAPSADTGEQAGYRSGGSLFRQGLLSALTNPKAVLFFAPLSAPVHRPGAGAADPVCSDGSHLRADRTRDRRADCQLCLVHTHLAGA